VQLMAGCEGLTLMEMKRQAESREDDDATAVTWCTMEGAPLVDGEMRMSRTKVRAMPPVAGGS
jgi:hypothetical protein